MDLLPLEPSLPLELSLHRTDLLPSAACLPLELSLRRMDLLPSSALEELLPLFCYRYRMRSPDLARLVHQKARSEKNFPEVEAEQIRWYRMDRLALLPERPLLVHADFPRQMEFLGFESR